MSFCAVCCVMCDKVYDESVRYPRVSAVKHSTRKEGELEKLEEFVLGRHLSV